MLRRKFVVWGALAQAAVLEAVRRKDLYVAMILSFLMIGMSAPRSAYMAGFTLPVNPPDD